MFRYSLSGRQIEELAKLFVNLGLLIFGSLVLRIFEPQTSYVKWQILPFGLILSLGSFWMGIKLFKEK